MRIHNPERYKELSEPAPVEDVATFNAQLYADIEALRSKHRLQNIVLLATRVTEPGVVAGIQVQLGEGSTCANLLLAQGAIGELVLSGLPMEEIHERKIYAMQRAPSLNGFKVGFPADSEKKEEADHG